MLFPEQRLPLTNPSFSLATAPPPSAARHPPLETDGQTSSGKTHTVTGSAKDPGMMVLAVQEVFDRIAKAGANTLFLVRVSYLEIYNESIRDLL